MTSLNYANSLNEIKNEKHKESTDIIILDDMKLNAYILKRLINKIKPDYSIETVYFVDQLYKMLKTKQPRYIVVDVELMEGICGLKVIEDLKQVLPNVIYIVYSGYPLSNTEQYEVIRKPIDIKCLEKIFAPL